MSSERTEFFPCSATAVPPPRTTNASNVTISRSLIDGEVDAASGESGDLTLLHPIAAGDMYGIDGVDHLTAPGQIRRIIAGSFPSGPSSAPPPKIVTAKFDLEHSRNPCGRLFRSIAH